MTRSMTNESIVLSRNNYDQLITSLNNPNDEYLRLRNEMFTEADSNISIVSNGTGLVVDFPNLDLSFIDEMNKRQIVATETLYFSIQINTINEIYNNISEYFCENTKKSVNEIMINRVLKSSMETIDHDFEGPFLDLAA